MMIHNVKEKRWGVTMQIIASPLSSSSLHKEIHGKESDAASARKVESKEELSKQTRGERGREREKMENLGEGEGGGRRRENPNPQELPSSLSFHLLKRTLLPDGMIDHSLGIKYVCFCTCLCSHKILYLAQKKKKKTCH